ncbi:MAG TPA: beta-phosphoglucomutase family hydrolase [Nitrosomonas nitrosa]|uniref:Haloacid dehalogenase superfamily, subfamily IA, variant 3 with third motif having DD or ED/beta-phosphoglucomutase family hydrolase n=1 Tax=Nitrosomonas aestuarii TaxID=52441 RepID=A0A1I4DXW0_9PROT|nr:beta-phosphoglucomutase family hydrolase [Nitrosomonas aestuarii]SFK98275.1 haloacid dehalogenase superfamily, subfamily IA, variant 3 with third motif having DD or ED/beta-phosphoglucomutase family hydrolase [Nitrosomonas aestuarii]HBZ29278.1 beta-phosphoglucomutase family hydrolase [Nitrosomonas nitrosa]HNP51772.1 beta-phosphoglucomutase family hydrolase [Nitrosomonas nitrosa]
MKTVITLSPRDYDAVLFDLDGVLTKTARVHAAAWKKLFDEFLEQRAARTGASFVPFNIDTDYRHYVDGKPRYDGVQDFLASREIKLPTGTPKDDADVQSVCALGNMKDKYFQQQLKQSGVETYEASIALVRKLRALEIKTAVVSSSNNCKAVLEAADIMQLFDARVDGTDLTRLNLNGKPAPDTFLEAARRVGVEPARAVVVEDAVAGVEAGCAGQFGCVIGVDRGGRLQMLREAGADIVVSNMGEVQVAEEASSSEWSLVFEGFDPAQEGIREALCTLGNGYFATRACVVWAMADGIHYPGTYLAGGYNRLRTDIAGRMVENEDLVNFPNWLALGLQISDQDLFDTPAIKILSYRQEISLRHSMLLRDITFEDGHGRRSTLRERRLVSMDNMHMGALEISLTADNWSANITVRSAIDGRIVNAGAKLYRKFNNKHLEPLASDVVGEDGVYLQVHTRQSNIHVAQAARTRAFIDGQLLDIRRRTIEEPGYIGQELRLNLKRGETLTLEKISTLYTSRDHAISECGLEARKAVVRAGDFDTVMLEHVLAWKHLWRRFDMNIQMTNLGFKLNFPMLLRLNMFHLLQTVSFNSIGLDISVPARGWTGEAYQGHIFWDDLFIFPFFNYRMPEITRALLMYRYRRLDEARIAARNAGYKGAMFPWQSGSNGQEETQAFNLNPRSQRWVPDNSYLQRHVGSAVAYNVWQYFQVTHDVEFLSFYGAELILDIARFWASIASFNDKRGRFEICGVMGPDEFHDAYPDSVNPGLNNNAYTNIMAVWVLCRALDVLEQLPVLRRSELMEKLNLSEEEISRWNNISCSMFVPFHGEGIISQFEGYEKLRELAWSDYRARYHNIQRLDLILEAENDSANHYKISKQADVLMLFYLFSADELRELFKHLGYPFEYETIPRNVDYYTKRSSCGSTLSRVVYAWVLVRSDRSCCAMDFFVDALQSDISDIQQGTTAEGVHLGAMAGSVDLIQRVSTGIEVRDDALRLNPELPQDLERLDMRIRYRGHSIDLHLTRNLLRIRERDGTGAPIVLCVDGKDYEFLSGTTREFPLSPKSPSV